MVQLTSSLPILVVLALAASIAPVLADSGAQGVIQDATSAAGAALSSLSSLFVRPAAAAPTVCCRKDCPPQACDMALVIPTDLAYAYPAPTPPPYKQSLATHLPCCTQGCADGACRNPKSTVSKRPETTHSSRRAKAENTLNIVIGCCKKCSNCDQAVTSLPQEEFLRVAEATPTPTAQLKAPLGPGQKAICIGCGKCKPCDFGKIDEFVAFAPHPRDEPSEDRIADAISTASSTTTAVATTTTTTTDDAPEPTYYLAEEINDAINGQNQDILPLVVASGDKKGEFRTLLATVDFKLAENYISRRFLAQLSLLKNAKPYPAGVDPTIAYLSHHQNKTVVDASIVLALAAGNADEGTQRHFSNVRFQVYGEENDPVIRIPDVVIGAKFLREVGGLTVFSRFRGKVQTGGVKLLYPAHPGVLDKDAGSVLAQGEEEVDQGGEEGKHDEL